MRSCALIVLHLSDVRFGSFSFSLNSRADFHRPYLSMQSLFSSCIHFFSLSSSFFKSSSCISSLCCCFFFLRQNGSLLITDLVASEIRIRYFSYFSSHILLWKFCSLDESVRLDSQNWYVLLFLIFYWWRERFLRFF